MKKDVRVCHVLVHIDWWLPYPVPILTILALNSHPSSHPPPVGQ